MRVVDFFYFCNIIKYICYEEKIWRGFSFKSDDSNLVVIVRVMCNVNYSIVGK